MINWSQALNEKSFPEPPKTMEVIQTHISYVFIVDELVYKIKKPVNFGFLDFTTLELRKIYCQKEFELNRRLCPNIYLGVVPISMTSQGYSIENDDRIVEYAVKMKKLPLKGMMQQVINERALTKKHIDLIIDVLVTFYKIAKTGEGINQYGSIETVSYNTEENFNQTAGYVGRAINRWRYNHVVNWTRSFLRNNETLFETRIKKGFIREGHGDLYSANICFDDLNRVYIFDCIEFNERFRCGDVASDIAFLSMDLDFHSYKELSEYFVNTYVERSADRDLLKLLNFYKCYRAYVRGKIGCFTSDDFTLPEEERNKAMDIASKYLDLAYLYAGGKPRVFVLFGLSGTGKSTLARSLREQILGEWIPSDIVRKNLAGIGATEHRYEAFEKGIYSRDYTERTYRKIVELAKDALSKGRDVILDATFRERVYREVLVNELGFANIHWIWCTADDNIIKNRLLKRKESEDISDAQWEIYLAQKEKFESPEEVDKERLMKVDTGADETKNLVSRIIEWSYNAKF